MGSDELVARCQLVRKSDVVSISANDPNLNMLKQFQLACRPLPGIAGALTTRCRLLPPSQGNSLFIPRMEGGLIAYILPLPENLDDVIDMAVITDMLKIVTSSTFFVFPGNRFAVPARLHPIPDLSHFLYEALIKCAGIVESVALRPYLSLPNEDPGIAPPGLTFIPNQIHPVSITEDLLTLDQHYNRIVILGSTDDQSAIRAKVEGREGSMGLTIRGDILTIEWVG